MEVISSLFNILAGFITDLLYDIDIVNTLFSFDLKRKVVQFKRDKNELYLFNFDEEINIYNRQKSMASGNSRNRIEDKLNGSKSQNDELSRSNVEQIKLKKRRKKIKFKKEDSISHITEPHIKINQEVKIKNKSNNNNSIVSTENLKVKKKKKT